MHGMCIFHAWNLAHFMHIPCVALVSSMHGTGIFYAWYKRIPCAVQAYSMRGTGVFCTWCRHIPCVVQAYSMHSTVIFHAWYRHVCTVCGTGIPMHAPYSLQACNKHTYRFCTWHTVLVVKSKGKYTLLIHALTVTGKWTELVGRIGCKDRQLLHTY